MFVSSRILGVLPVTLALPLLAVIGCGSTNDEIPPPPRAEEIAAYYDYAGELSVEMSGNVAQVTVVIDRQQYLAGGELWARAAPYIFLFTPGTGEALSDHPGLGGIRVVVRYGDGTMLAQALLPRGALVGGNWTRTLNIAAQARAEGSERPGFMRQLVNWGEDHTDFEYNPDYVSGTP